MIVKVDDGDDVTAWLILEVALHFNEKLKPITNKYQGDLQPADGNMHYGAHLSRRLPRSILEID